MTSKSLGPALIFGLLLSTASADAPRRSQAAKNDEKRENEAVRKAQQELKEAVDAERNAERSAQRAVDAVRTAERALTQATARLQKVRDELESKHAEAAKLTAARKTADEARQAYQAASQPFLQRLTETSAYQQALAAAQSAEESLKKLPSDDTADTARKERAELARAAQEPARLQREALEAETSLNPLRNRLKGADEGVAAAQRIIDRAIENDPALKEVRDQIERARQQVAAARKDAAQEERQLAEARQKVVRRRMDVQQKVAADQRDDNRGKPRNKK